jgi:aspartyl-tRNA(Asn)/glutamyl-tRNA(Gln) amidotransferase subunit A
VGYLFDRLDADVEQTMANTIEFLQRRGATISDVHLPHAGDIATVYLHLVLADAAAYHARTLESRPQDYTPNVRLRLEMARYVLAEDYIRALRGKAIITKEVDQALRGVDVLICPALSIPAPPIGATTMPVKGGTDAVRTLMLRCTQPFNVSGHPAISLPCGKTPAGMPIGLQLVGHKGRTAALVQAALAVEKVITEQ